MSYGEQKGKGMQRIGREGGWVYRSGKRQCGRRNRESSSELSSDGRKHTLFQRVSDADFTLSSRARPVVRKVVSQCGRSRTPRVASGPNTSHSNALPSQHPETHRVEAESEAERNYIRPMP